MFTPGISDGLGLERWDCQSFMVAMVPAESPVVSSFNADAVSSHIQIVISARHLRLPRCSQLLNSPDQTRTFDVQSPQHHWTMDEVRHSWLEATPAVVLGRQRARGI